MVAGQAIQTQPQTKEFDEGYERTFGKDRSPIRGRFVQRPETGELIPASEYVRPASTRALDAPIMAGRFYENVCTVDGVDIGSRKKRREYMRSNNLADTDDFKGEWTKAAKRRDEIREGRHDSKERREALGRAMYQLERKGR
ncbi:MAG TPA: hypothetical protein DCP69_10560 [Candidatus Omnitrophica bacterium]|nr:hypothetical protein [Candidatus Omnitrophota bacterium]